jgi:glycine/D-amino acid oxidase-like deaminating enzyme/nitrite reductase/ring-hydroxylating ferredoxin subunit
MSRRPGIQGTTRPAWAADTPDLDLLEPLDASTRTDVCVVGAGIAGLSTAYHLCRAGVSVVVVERAGIGAGETARTTAHLTAVLDYRYRELQQVQGRKAARLVAESHLAAIASIEQIAQDESLACDFHRLDGYLFESAPGASPRSLEKEARAAGEVGLQCELLPSGPLPFPCGPTLRVAGQAQIHPLKYLSGLARAVQRRGVRVFQGHVRDVDEGEAVTITLETGQRIVAGACVVATNTPIHDRVAMHTKQYPHRTYVLGLRVPRGALPPGLFWDTDEPYHYLRTASAESLGLEHPGEDVLIVGGEDHKVGQDPECTERWERLEQWTRERVPSAGATLFRWSGQVQEPADGLGSIGLNPRSRGNVYIATGHSGNGITYGALAGLLLTDRVLGRQNAWQDVYEPSRKPSHMRSLGRFVRENLNVAKRYADLMRPGDVRSVSEIPRGEGRVLRRKGKLLAVYVDDAGAAHERSAICTHLGCVVAWNPAERSWDCPCHGSRYEATGELLMGPASRDLAAASESESEPREERRPPKPGTWLEPGKL